MALDQQERIVGTFLKLANLELPEEPPTEMTDDLFFL